MSVIRVIIVDDSAFVRKAVREMFSRSPLIEVVGQARDGQDALQLVAELKPDVVTCDLVMPGMDGVEFVRQQMAVKPLPILILTASPQDAARVLEALDAGAVDFIQKPTALASEELMSVRDELIQKVKAAAQTPARSLLFARRMPPATPPVPPRPSRSGSRRSKVGIVVLGISTGGPQALRYLIPQFAPDFPVPFVIVLHMPVGYTAMFAEKLAEISRLPVKEASEGCEIRAGEVLVAAAGRHFSFNKLPNGRVVAQLTVHPLDKPHRPSVDVLFESAARTYGDGVLAVVMTGMGDDGKQGAAWIKAQGGTVLTEAEESCVIYGMPRSVVEAGLSDGAVSLTGMAAEIVKRL